MSARLYIGASLLNKSVERVNTPLPFMYAHTSIPLQSLALQDSFRAIQHSGTQTSVEESISRKKFPDAPCVLSAIIKAERSPLSVLLVPDTAPLSLEEVPHPQIALVSVYQFKILMIKFQLL